MSRPALAASLFALVLVAGVLAPRLQPTSAPVAPVTPPAPRVSASIPELSTIPEAPLTPGSIIPEATEPFWRPIPVPPLQTPQIILPEAPFNEWDGCPACGMG